MPTTSTAYGRSEILWPDFGHDGGTSLHTKKVTAIELISNNLSTKWTGSQTVANAAFYDYVHNFSLELTELTILVYESGVLLTAEEQAASYAITQNSVESIRITNQSGGSKTFDAYVFGFSMDKLLGRKNSSVTTTDATVTTLTSISIPTNKAAVITANISARKDGTTENIYSMIFAANNNAGTVSVTQLNKFQSEDDVDWDATIDASGATARVRVTGEAATTLLWTAKVETNYI